MVSPRKTPSKSTTRSRHNSIESSLSGKKTPTSTSTNTRKSGHHSQHHNIFGRLKFYLDLKSTRTAPVKKLIEDIKLLGGTIEGFFSKDLTTVISDAPEWKLRNPSGSLSSVASPSTPSCFSNSPTWSPSASSIAEEASSTKKTLTTRSRVDTILERALQQNKGGTSNSSWTSNDVIDNAHRFGLQIWSLNKVIIWIEKYKAKIAAGENNHRHYNRSNSLGSSSENEKKPLISPYIKFEVNNFQYRPVALEFKFPNSFPQLNICGKPGTSPFAPPPLSTQSVAAAAPTLQESARKRLRRNADSHHLKPIQGSATAAVSTPIIPVAPPTSNKAKVVSGFCEICENNFKDLTAHIESKTHIDKVSSDSFWSQLDSCMTGVNEYKVFKL